MNADDLMDVACTLAESDHAPTMQARLRRAVSTAYYAMFHCLAEAAADLFIGSARSPAWHRTYRALEHGRARRACQQAQTMPEFPPEVRDFAKAFVIMQVERQKADYALDTRTYRSSDVQAQVLAAGLAIGQFGQAAVEAKRGFAAHVLFRQRSP